MTQPWISELDGEALEWARRGSWLEVGGDWVFVVDTGGGDAVGEAPPLVYLHGFPTSSIDLAPVIDDLARHRRVVTLDYPGYGLSDKPDRRYTMAGCADAVAGVLAQLGIDRCSLMSHDMGDTVCGELLARSMEGTWAVEVVDRVLTNGSIYLALAQLTDGQRFLLSLPDERLPDGTGPDADGLSVTLAATLSPSMGEAGPAAMAPAARLVVGGGGGALMPRLIRYLEERRDNESRFTGALERHPSPVRVVWGADDPIAVVDMVERFRSARPDADVVVLDGVGHYPMVEAPERFVEAVGASRSS